jgi:amino acid permease
MTGPPNIGDSSSLTLLVADSRLSESSMATNPAVQSEASETTHSHLVRGLGLWAAIAIVIGDTIGTVVFLVSSDMARALGSRGLVLVAWVLGGFIVLLGAFCYAELGAAFPKAGGPYVYLGRGLGPVWGFLFGWMSSFLTGPSPWQGWGLASYGSWILLSAVTQHCSQVRYGTRNSPSRRSH